VGVAASIGRAAGESEDLCGGVDEGTSAVLAADVVRSGQGASDGSTFPPAPEIAAGSQRRANASPVRERFKRWRSGSTARPMPRPAKRFGQPREILSNRSRRPAGRSMRRRAISTPTDIWRHCWRTASWPKAATTPHPPARSSWPTRPRQALAAWWKRAAAEQRAMAGIDGVAKLDQFIGKGAGVFSASHAAPAQAGAISAI